MNSPQRFPRRLRNERFEQGRPKPVIEVPGFAQRAARLPLTDEHKDDLDDLIERIERGDLLPEGRYRHGVGRDDDRMLDEYGIKHLHLGPDDSDLLLFLVEYPEKVVLLGIYGHDAFKGEPPGSVLHSLYQAHLHGKDRDSEERAREQAERVRSGLLTRREDRND